MDSKLLMKEGKRLFRSVLLPGQVLLRWCFLELESTRNGCRLLFSIFEYVIRFCWVFTERVHYVESVQIWSYFWSVFSCIRTKYRKIRTGNKSIFGHFSRSDGTIDYWNLGIIDYLKMLLIICLIFEGHLVIQYLTLSWRRPLSFRNQSID